MWTLIQDHHHGLFNAAMDSISFEKKVVIGSSDNVNVPALTVFGTDSGPTSPSAKFIRSQFRNNVLLFETSEVENNYMGSIGLIQAAQDFSSPNQFAIGVNDGIEWKNPLRIYFENKAMRFGFGDDSYSQPKHIWIFFTFNRCEFDRTRKFFEYSGKQYRFIL